jgi:hypothetical protein
MAPLRENRGSVRFENIAAAADDGESGDAVRGFAHFPDPQGRA